MGKPEKLLSKLRNASNTFPWAELLTLLTQLGYGFYNAASGHMIRLHRPHPENTIKGGALKAVRQTLIQEGYL